MRNDETDSKKIDANTVTLMVIEELDQKQVSLYMFDAATEIVLSHIEKIEVAIAM